MKLFAYGTLMTAEGLRAVLGDSRGRHDATGWRACPAGAASGTPIARSGVVVS